MHNNEEYNIGLEINFRVISKDFGEYLLHYT